MSAENKNGWQRIILAFIPILFVGGLFQLIGATLLHLNIQHINHQNFTTFQHFILNLSYFLGTIFILYIFITYQYKEKFKDLGFQSLKIIDVCRGLMIGFIVMFSGFCILLLNKQLKIISINFNLYEILLSSLSFLCVSFTEEVFIRGFILGNLLKSTNKFFALIISSIIFSLMHSFNPNMDSLSYINLFLVGILLGISYVITKNLWFPIALHFSWNFFQGTVFGFNVSGLKAYSIIQQENLSNNLLNGGLFGFEGSILSTILLLLFIPIIYYLYKNERYSIDN